MGYYNDKREDRKLEIKYRIKKIETMIKFKKLKRKKRTETKLKTRIKRKGRSKFLGN